MTNLWSGNGIDTHRMSLKGYWMAMNGLISDESAIKVLWLAMNAHEIAFISDGCTWNSIHWRWMLTEGPWMVFSVFVLGWSNISQTKQSLVECGWKLLELYFNTCHELFITIFLYHLTELLYLSNFLTLWPPSQSSNQQNIQYIAETCAKCWGRFERFQRYLTSGWI